MWTTNKRLSLASISLVLILTGCSSLGFIGKAIGGLGGGSNTNSGVQVETDDVVIGKKEEETAVNTQLGNNTESTQAADQITNITEQGLSPMVFWTLIFLAGWAIPDPRVMGAGLLSLLQTLIPWGHRNREHEETPKSQ